MRIISINVNEFENGFDNELKSLWIDTDGLYDYINAELSWFTPEELLEGYTTEFTGELKYEVLKGFYDREFYFCNLKKWKGAGEKIYFETFLEEQLESIL